MMRSLWTGATGMTAQQMNVDVISNNLANVNTVGFKRERVEFKSLLYQTMQRADLDPANPTGRPVNLQVGLGVRPAATARIFTTGSFQMTEQPLDFAINGDGFFVVNRSIEPGELELGFTRNGAIKASPMDEGLMLVTSDGMPFLDIDDEPMFIPPDVNIRDLIVAQNGMVSVMVDGEIEDLFQIAMVQFPNVQGLESFGRNLLLETPASGAPMLEADGDVTRPSMLERGVLEMSNVNIATEMVDLIVAQRAYELNSRAITTSDQMLETANQLKR